MRHNQEILAEYGVLGEEPGSHAVYQHAQTDVLSMLCVDVTWLEGWTPLHCAAQQLNPDMVDMLLAHGAGANVKDVEVLSCHLSTCAYLVTDGLHLPASHSQCLLLPSLISGFNLLNIRHKIWQLAGLGKQACPLMCLPQ